MKREEKNEERDRKVVAERSLLRMLVELVMGRRYYANVTFTRGSGGDCGLAYFIFGTKEQARAHALSLSENRSFGYVETVTFRSRREY